MRRVCVHAAAVCCLLATVLVRATPLAAAGGAQYVGNAAELIIALNNSTVTLIWLNSSTIEVSVAQLPDSAVIQVQRSLTITRAPNLPYLPTLSFGKLFARLYLGPTVELDIHHVELLGMHNPGSNSPTWSTLDMVAMSPGSTVDIHDALLINLVCPPLDAFLQTLRATQWPASMTGIQQLMPLPSNYCLSGLSAVPRCFPSGALLISQMAYKAPIVGEQGGYLYLLHNVTMACNAVVGNDCLRNATLGTCMTALLAQVDPISGQPLADLSAVQLTYEDEDGKHQHFMPVILGVVLAVAVAGLASAGGLFVYCQHKRRKQGIKSTSSSPIGSKGSRLLLARHLGSSSNHSTNPNELHLGVLIGCGSYGRVYRGRWRGHDVAVKKILHSPAEGVKIQRELALSMALNHPNVVKSIDSLQMDATGHGSGNNAIPSSQGSHGSGFLFPSANPTSRSGQSPCHLSLETWLVQELCDQGPLSTAVYAGCFHDRNLANASPNWVALLLRARDVAAGMEYLHARGICHGDLKSENVLLQTSPSDPFKCVAKICDFGLSRALAEGRSHVTSKNFGTVTHMSPEILETGKLRPACDVYSYGVMCECCTESLKCDAVWEMVSGAPPYAGLRQGEIVRRIVLEKQLLAFPPRTLQAVKALAHKCWQTEPDARPTFKDVCATVTSILQGLAPKLVAELAPSWELHTQLVAQAAAAPSLHSPCTYPTDSITRTEEGDGDEAHPMEIHVLGGMRSSPEKTALTGRLISTSGLIAPTVVSMLRSASGHDTKADAAVNSPSHTSVNIRVDATCISPGTPALSPQANGRVLGAAACTASRSHPSCTSNSNSPVADITAADAYGGCQQAGKTAAPQGAVGGQQQQLPVVGSREALSKPDTAFTAVPAPTGHARLEYDPLDHSGYNHSFTAERIRVGSVQGGERPEYVAGVQSLMSFTGNPYP